MSKSPSEKTRSIRRRLDSEPDPELASPWTFSEDLW